MTGIHALIGMRWGHFSSHSPHWTHTAARGSWSRMPCSVIHERVHQPHRLGERDRRGQSFRGLVVVTQRPVCESQQGQVLHHPVRPPIGCVRFALGVHQLDCAGEWVSELSPRVLEMLCYLGQEPKARFLLPADD